MPRERLSMRKIREVLRLHGQCGLSRRQIAASCQIGLGTVSEYLQRAAAAGLGWPLPPEWTDAELEARLYPPPVTPAAGARPLPDWAEVARELKRKGVTLRLLWEEYRGGHPEGYGYSRFCERFQEWRRETDGPRMHVEHRAGEKLFVDYAGMTMPVTDPRTGAVRDAQIFVATLGASSYTYAEATWTQALPDWLGSHVRAFEFFQGVPEIVVPDNLKSGVRSPCYYDPDLNRSYLELAQHYGVAVLPARVRKPRDKAKVENGVQQVERRVLAPLRHETFFSLTALNEGVGTGLAALNEGPAPGLPAPRAELFATLDQPALRPLPSEPFRLLQWLKARVGLDYHVQVERHWYSVPYSYFRKPVEVCLTSRTVEIFHRQERIASHLRSYRPHAYTTLPEHLPPAHRVWSEWPPERFLDWARKGGPATGAAIEQLLAAHVHPEQAFRACLGILRLGNQYGTDRLEAACHRAVRRDVVSYASLKSILECGLDQPSLPEPEPESLGRPLQHANLRGAAYYDGSER